MPNYFDQFDEPSTVPAPIAPSGGGLRQIVAPRPKAPTPQTPEQAIGDVLANVKTQQEIDANTRKAAQPEGVSANDISAARARLTDVDALKSLITQYENAAAPYMGTLTPGEISAQIPFLAYTPGIRTRDNAAQAFTPILRRMQRTPGDPLAAAETQAYDQWLPSINVTDEENQLRIERLKDYVNRTERGALSVLPESERERYLSSAGPQDISTPIVPPPSVDGGQSAPPSRPMPPAFSEGATQYQAATGTRSVSDDAMRPIAAEYRQRLGSGQSADEILNWLRGSGVGPATLVQAAKQIQYRELHPNTPISSYPVNFTREEPVTMMEEVANAVGDNPAGAWLARAGNALLANTTDELSADPERTQMALAALDAQYPTASVLGDIGGNVMAAMLGEAALARLGMAPGLLRGLTADTGMGVASGAGGAEDGARLRGGLTGGAYAGVSSGAGSALGRGVQAVARGVTDPSVRALSAEAVPMTIGQAYGQSGKVGAFVKGLEDRISGTPIAGDIVNDRRRAGVEQFNAKVFDRALRSIGGTVDGQIGEGAVAAAQQQVSDAFQKALGGKYVQYDHQFGQDLYRAFARTQRLARVGPELAQDVRNILEPYIQGQALSGEAMQAVSRDIQALKAAWRQDTRANAVGNALNEIEDSIFGMFERQAPEVLQEYRAAKDAYRRLSIVEDAVLRAKNKGGVFSPAQLGMADRANSVKFDGKKAAARGDSPFHDLQRAAQNVLPNEVPDSGTAGRLIVPALMLGGGAAADASGITDGGGITLGAILAGAYSKAGQRLLTKPARGMSGRTGKILSSDRTPQLLGRAAAGSAAAALPGTSPSR